jgi:hypothetical protein
MNDLHIFLKDVLIAYVFTWWKHLWQPLQLRNILNKILPTLGGGQFLIHMGNCWAWKPQLRCSSWRKPVCQATIPCSKVLKSFVLTIHPLKGTHTQSHVSILSRLKNHFLTCLLPFVYTYLKWIKQLTLIRDHNVDFIWIHLVSLCHGKAGVHNVLYTQCISIVFVKIVQAQ